MSRLLLGLIITAVLLTAGITTVYVVVRSGEDSSGPNIPAGSVQDSQFLPVPSADESSGARRSYIAGRPIESVNGAIPYWDQRSAVASFQQHIDQFDSISVFWYALSADGSVVKYPYAVEDTSLIDFAREHGVQVYAIVANLPPEGDDADWDADRVDEAISTAARRNVHVAQLVALADRLGFDGIILDYEALRGNQRSDFSAFVRRLADALHAEGKILGVSLMPKISEGNPLYTNGSEAQDWVQLAEHADQLYLMTYEEHWETSEPGSVASLPWVRSVLEYARATIPSSKLFAGVALYGYDWGGARKARGLTYQNVQRLIDQYSPHIQWDAAAGSKHFTYEVRGTQHDVWYEDADSVAAKLDLFRSLGITNIELWRLGGEDPAVWDALRLASGS